jgi:hypothetical protein
LIQGFVNWVGTKQFKIESFWLDLCFLLINEVGFIFFGCEIENPDKKIQFLAVETKTQI